MWCHKTMKQQCRPFVHDENWQPFYNLETRAAYDFSLQLVTLDSVCNEILGALRANAPAARYKVLCLGAHEYTHWIDHVSTLWGRNLLYEYYRGLTASEDRNVEEFPWIVRAFNSINRSTSSPYFFVKGPRSGSPSPWTWTLSLGLRFDALGKLKNKDPIPFVRFGKGNPLDENNLIVRMPISAASICEVRGMAAEYSWITRERNIFSGNTPADPERFAREYGSQLYDENFLLYTTGLHVLANHCGATEVTDILEYASRLGWVVLNFPQSLLGKLRMPDEWQQEWQDPEIANIRCSALIEGRDPGFIFCVLTKFAKQPKGMDCASWLDDLLLAAGDFTLSDFEHEWLEELERTSAQALVDLPNPRFVTCMNIGQEWARRIGPSGGTDELLLGSVTN